jgi:hypothetical protein
VAVSHISATETDIIPSLFSLPLFLYMGHSINGMPLLAQTLAMGQYPWVVEHAINPDICHYTVYASSSAQGYPLSSENTNMMNELFKLSRTL